MLIFIALTSLLFAGDICDSVQTTNVEFDLLSTRVEERLKKSSHLVTIATEADSVLSKLLSHKSPVLINWINKRQLMDKKEEEIAAQWRYYYLNEFILSKYPTAKPAINTSVETLFEDINRLAFPQAQRQKIERIFKQTQKDAIQLVKTMQLPNQAKEAILNRVKGIELYWFKKLKGSRYQNKPLEFLRWGLAYDPPHNQINVGLYTRKYSNEESLYGVFAHEIGHSIDSCRWDAYIKTENPFSELYKCLRSPTSANAKRRDDAKMASMIKKKYLSQEMAESLKANPTCNRSFYPPDGTQKDQLPEVFADWYSAEVLANASIELKHIRPDLCQKTALTTGSSYLSHNQRHQRVYAVQPKLKEKFKLTSEFKHCSMQPLTRSMSIEQ